MVNFIIFDGVTVRMELMGNADKWNFSMLGDTNGFATNDPEAHLLEMTSSHETQIK